MSQPDSPGGVDGLRARRERNRRTPPQPHHPKDPPDPSSTDTENEIGHEISHEIVRETSEPIPDVPTTSLVAAMVERAPARETTPRKAAVAVPKRAEQPLPRLDVDLTDAAAMMITPTVLSIPGVIMRRFEAARPRSASHTALVLNALRANAGQLPALVLARRPGPRPGDLFPYRAEPGEGTSTRPAPLRIRPTVGELNIMDALTTWVNAEIGRQRPGGRRVSRSEVVAVALDAFLPPARQRTASPAGAASAAQTEETAEPT